MTEAAVPENVRKFLIERVRSLMSLELLLLVRKDPTRTWSALELARELRSSDEWIGKESLLLADRGILLDAGGGTYRYDPTGEWETALAWLAHAYPHRRHSIIGVIYSSPGDSVQDFADAFRLRKEKPNG